MIDDWRLKIVFLLVCGGLMGCSRGIDTFYGQRKGALGASSVNGTAVLGEMFEQAGHKVFSWRQLSPKLQQRADCIVWFPNDFEPPGDDVREWLDAWLLDGPGRTLIYIGRDFDAGVAYWEKVEGDAPPAQLKLLRREKTAAKIDFRQQRKSTSPPPACDWFTIEDKYRPRRVQTLAGRPQWCEGIDPSRLEIELSGRLVPPNSAEVLLESEGDVLVSRREIDGSQLIVVANGSFLLNLPLVNHEHRKLAGKLIDSVGPPGQSVVFLESYAGGPPISDEDPSANMPTGYAIFLAYPVLFSHLLLIGVILCFSRWPIFGVPRELEPPRASDFGKHIRALAELLERSRDRAYATTRLLHYQQTTSSIKGNE